MDDADRAQIYIDSELSAALRARTSAKTYRLHCSDCFALLDKHRREYGLCIDCAHDREVRAARHGN